MPLLSFFLPLRNQYAFFVRPLFVIHTAAKCCFPILSALSPHGMNQAMSSG